MKFWLSSRNLLNSPNYHRTLLSHTLHIRYNNSFLISHPHLPRRKLRMTYSILTRKRSFYILYLSISPRRTRYILWILYIHRNMKYWSSPTIRSNSYSIHRLCTSMRTNIILRCNSNYKPSISYPLYRNNPSWMNLRRILSRQGHTNPFLRLPLYFTIHYYSYSYRPPSISPRNRIKQPNRPKLRRRQNSISPLLYN